MARPPAVAGFNATTRTNIMKGKMAGRKVMVRTNQGAIFALVNERFLEVDAPDNNLEIRVRIANPIMTEAFFTELCNKWYESRG
ncbi:hypothetical protein C1645_818172 [Glomus cerebriforme]|uniref:Uncharacterized protein n=1 Tax=Glomus cerebriforme TaxID=658196 RepID=A0A397T817_9GLOM|nr:hypothetical protein C1645_818172 [Glomus cerebriforme]